VVALLISLKIQLIRGALRGSTSQRIGFAIAIVFGALAGIGGTIAVALMRAAPPAWAAAGVVGAGTLLVLGWTLIPLLVSGSDETLDPSRFALLPLRARQLVPGLLLSGLVGVPGVVTTLLGLATLVVWTRGPVAFVLAVPAAVLGVLTCVLAARLVTTAAARLLAARRFREVGTTVAVLLMSSLGLWPTLLSHADVGVPAQQLAQQLTDPLGWTPFGLAWAAPADAATGHLGRGLIRLVLAVLVLGLGAWAWARLLDRALADQSSGGSATRAQVGRSVLDRLPDGPVWAVVARCLRYWRRDPRYLVASGALLVSSVVPVVAIRSGSGAMGVAVAAGPYMGLFFGLVTANDIGYDGSAFATHLLTGLPGRLDRAGRAIAALLWAGPLVMVAAVLGALLSGNGDLWPGAVGATLAGLLGGAGCSALAGALVPYPVPEAGSNPFRGSSGGGARAALAQGAVMGATLSLMLPSIALLVVSGVWWRPAGWIALVLGPVTGAIALRIGIALGGQTVDARGPEILAAVRRPT
jgi:ABC-2 type transport system permease protein